MRKLGHIFAPLFLIFLLGGLVSSAFASVTFNNQVIFTYRNGTAFHNPGSYISFKYENATDTFYFNGVPFTLVYTCNITINVPTSDTKTSPVIGFSVTLSGNDTNLHGSGNFYFPNGTALGQNFTVTTGTFIVNENVNNGTFAYYASGTNGAHDYKTVSFNVTLGTNTPTYTSASVGTDINLYYFLVIGLIVMFIISFILYPMLGLFTTLVGIIFALMIQVSGYLITNIVYDQATHAFVYLTMPIGYYGLIPFFLCLANGLLPLLKRD